MTDPELVDLTPWSLSEYARYMPKSLGVWMADTVRNCPNEWSDDKRTTQELISDWMKVQVSALQNAFILGPTVYTHTFEI